MRLVIVDDHPLVRRGLISVLKEEKDIEMVKEASNITEAVSLITKEQPDIAIIDLKLGNENGLDIVARSKKLSNTTKFMILTTFISQEDFLKGEQIGVDGYMLKDAFFEDLFYAVKSINRGKKYYDPGIIDYSHREKENNLISQLTDREKEVLLELGKGFSNEDIAKKLFISENTVKKHVSNILLKMNLKQRSQVVALVNSK